MENQKFWRNKRAYDAVHQWVRYHLGPANRCEEDITHEANRFHWSNISSKYKRNKEDWKQLCPPCHARDRRTDKCKNGHERTEENTYVRASGLRYCRLCRREYVKKWKNKNLTYAK